ncbi:MAG: TlpA family protein disulfide reductase [Sphingomonadaceae bacterium]|nr:TlpA family protein disulfide reductase [Sphingomonadaceae bacterium]
MLTAAILGSAVLVAGCDRQTGQEAQPQASTPAAAGAPGTPAKAGEADRSRKGSEMPDFTFTDPSGQKLAMRSLIGQPVLVNLWATWCAPCVAELPALDKLAASQQGKLKVLTISQDSGQPEKAGEFLRQRGVTRLEPWLDPKNDLAFHYGAETLPATILYDAKGREVWRIYGPREWGDAETLKLISEGQ